MKLFQSLKVIVKNNASTKHEDYTFSIEEQTVHLELIEDESGHVLDKEEPIQDLTQLGKDQREEEGLSPSFVCMTSTYNENSGVQASAAASIMCPMLLKAVKNITTDSLSKNDDNKNKGKLLPLTIAEYGCATGGSSLAPLNTISSQLDKQREMNVIMNDLPLNDWDVLSETLRPIKHRFRNLVLKKMSMYDSGVAKDNTLHIGYSCFAQHWLSVGFPTDFPLGSSAIWPQQLTCDKTKNVWAKAAMNDWNQFLDRRFDELISGGYVVIIIQASLDDGTLSENNADTLMKVKELMMVERTLSPQEAAKMTMPEYLKTQEEILAPFKRELNISRWDVEEVLLTELDCPNFKKLSSTTTSVSEVVKKQIGLCRSFMDSSLTLAIGEDKVGKFWDRVETFVDDDPSALESNISAVSLMLKKK